MSQFDAAIAILTDDDEDDDDSSENEIYSKPEPETESKSARRPIIGRQDRSRDRGDGQSDSSDGWQAVNCGDACNGKYRKHDEAPGSRKDWTETGNSGGCPRSSLSVITLVVLCLLVIAFPVHFPAVLLPDYLPTDGALRLVCSLAMTGAIVSSLTSRLTSKMAGVGTNNFRSLPLLCACAGVTAFAAVRCFRSSAPEAVLGVAAFAAGWVLTWARLVAAAAASRAFGHRRSPLLGPSGLDGGFAGQRTDLAASTYLAVGVSTSTLSGLAPFLSAALHLILLATYQSSSPADVESPMTSFPVPVGNWSTSIADAVTVANLTDWSNDTFDLNYTTVSATSAYVDYNSTENTSTDPIPTSSSSNDSRLTALSVCYVVCSLGALLLTICAFDEGRYCRSDKTSSSWTVSGAARLVLEPMNAFRRQEVALLSPFAAYVGAQQLFAYFAYVQAFVPREAGAHTPAMAGLCMAGTTLLVSAVVGYLLRYVGRVKLLLAVAMVMMALLLTLLLLDESRSRDPVTYFVIGSLWSVCDSCVQICFAAIICLLSDAECADDDVEHVDDDVADCAAPNTALQGAVTACYSGGQLLTFLLYSFLASASSTLLCLIIALPLAVFGYLAVEIRLRLPADDDAAESLLAGGSGSGRGRRRRRYVAVTTDDHGTTWLPRYDPAESPRKDRVHPLFDDRAASTAAPILR